MRWLAISIIAAAALAGATIASASGSQGDQGGGTAYALVDPNGGSPRLIAGHTSGFTAVSLGTQGQGDYCLTAASGVDLGHTAAVASQEAFYSSVLGLVLVRYQPNNPDCNPNQLEVKTFDANLSGLSDQVAFTVNVP